MRTAAAAHQPEVSARQRTGEPLARTGVLFRPLACRLQHRPWKGCSELTCHLLPVTDLRELKDGATDRNAGMEQKFWDIDCSCSTPATIRNKYLINKNFYW